MVVQHKQWCIGKVYKKVSTTCHMISQFQYLNCLHPSLHGSWSSIIVWDYRIDVNENDPRRELSFTPLIQHIHSTPAMPFLCVLTYKNTFNKDGQSFMSFEKGLGPAVQWWPWNLHEYLKISQVKQQFEYEKINEYLSGLFLDDRCARREAFMHGNLNIAK